jgi:hypothetical protein
MVLLFSRASGRGREWKMLSASWLGLGGPPGLRGRLGLLKINKGTMGNQMSVRYPLISGEHIEICNLIMYVVFNRGFWSCWRSEPFIALFRSIDEVI